MQIFYVADLTPQGELRQFTEYDYATLERIPGAVDLIGRSFRRWRYQAALARDSR